ncbi:unnamed protein product [Hydatigera taeniaeformis]|uniref:CxC1 domain-containing protein n=1 Tax=Hydatigena taeniaeformis TaxID=6205 RepID=A0A0R3WUQ8_HYDTA|nr:unnamed protein product [Hydatigera taeniaeformis]
MLVAFNICEYLDAVSLINCCATIPRWGPILSHPFFFARLRNHIQQWDWIDERLWCLLLPQSWRTSVQCATEVIQYRQRQIESFQRTLSEAPQHLLQNPVHFWIFANTTLRWLPPHELTVQLKRPELVESPTTTYSVCVSHDVTRRIVVCKCSTNLGDLEFPHRIIAVREETESDTCDCLLYVADPLRFSMRDLTITLLSLTPSQLLIIAVVVDEMRDRSGRMDCLLTFAQRIGHLNRHLLSAIPTQWRLWCVERGQENFVNWTSLVEWGCCDVIAKRM